MRNGNCRTGDAERGIVRSLALVSPFWLTLLLGCLCLPVVLTTGCIVQPMKASDLFGDAQESPKIKVKKSIGPFGIFGVASAEAGGEFAGTLDATYDPNSGGFHIIGDVKHNPTPVIGANAELIKAMEPTRLADFQRVVQQQESLKEMWIAGFEAAKAVGSSAVGAFLGKSAAAFPETGGLPPGVNIGTILEALQPHAPALPGQ